MISVKTVNGVSVSSNKKITAIIRSKVLFDDGSWCDVSTREIVAQRGATITLSGNKKSRRGDGNVVASNGSVVVGNLTGSVVITGGNVVANNDGGVIIRSGKRRRW